MPGLIHFATVHFNKRSPINFRVIEGVRPTKNPYTVAHFACACSLLRQLTGDAALDSVLASRLDWLCDNRVGAAWAYPFDVQTKTFAYKKTVPNVICTAFSIEALLDGAEPGRVERARLTSCCTVAESGH